MCVWVWVWAGVRDSKRKTKLNAQKRKINSLEERMARARERGCWGRGNYIKLISPAAQWPTMPKRHWSATKLIFQRQLQLIINAPVDAARCGRNEIHQANHKGRTMCVPVCASVCVYECVSTAVCRRLRLRLSLKMPNGSNCGEQIEARFWYSIESEILENITFSNTHNFLKNNLFWFWRSFLL